MKRNWIILLAALLTFGAPPRSSWAESQGNDYKGITDPFGDPSNYEFAEDEKDDKEFFHLGRFLMLGIDGGLGLFTGGLGSTTDPGAYVGARFIYFFDRALALEVAAHYANHLNTMHPDSSQTIQIDTNLIPLTMGMRYYFDTKNIPKAIAVANPYLAAGVGIYMRGEKVIANSNPATQFQISETTTSNFGAYGGAGVEFLIYRKHIYLGLDSRFHVVFFPDSSSGIAGLPSVDRSGNYISIALSLTYNF